MRQSVPIEVAIEAVCTIAVASEAEEWHDVLKYLPFQARNRDSSATISATPATISASSHSRDAGGRGGMPGESSRSSIPAEIGCEREQRRDGTFERSTDGQLPYRHSPLDRDRPSGQPYRRWRIEGQNSRRRVTALDADERDPGQGGGEVG